ncbi:MAG: hypothetical protein EZS28_033501, partial [Streblomastix strix]
MEKLKSDIRSLIPSWGGGGG